MQQVIDTGGPTAHACFCDLREIELRNITKQRTRLGVNALSVAKVTGILVSHTQGKGISPLQRWIEKKNLGDITALA
jgi:hypothetical protein